ncbi:MAG: N-acetylmuramoyl-L-alanine amidase [Microcystaceae cyanobacterium]
MKPWVTLLMGMASSWLIGLPAWAGSVEYWKFNVQDSRLDIVTDQSVRPQVQLVANPTRLVIDLPGIIHRGPTLEKSVTSYIRSVRLGRVDGNTTRIVIELAADYQIRPWEVKIQGLAPNRWTAQLPTLLTPAEYTLPADNIAIAVPEPPPVPVRPTRSRQAVTVVIDPGHGGRDPGAIGLRGQQEKVIVLAIARAVARELEAQGINVVMTREDDRFISLKGRVVKAESVKADIFVSIHANAIGRGRSHISGLETYHYQSGASLARSIHRSILNRVAVRDRGVRRARFYVLRKTSMPSTLVEVGFVTGAEDNRKLANPQYRQRMAEAIAAGIMNYLR